jgi:hypothetical protein
MSSQELIPRQTLPGGNVEVTATTEPRKGPFLSHTGRPQRQECESGAAAESDMSTCWTPNGLAHHRRPYLQLSRAQV